MLAVVPLGAPFYAPAQGPKKAKIKIPVAIFTHSSKVLRKNLEYDRSGGSLFLPPCGSAFQLVLWSPVNDVYDIMRAAYKSGSWVFVSHLTAKDECVLQSRDATRVTASPPDLASTPSPTLDEARVRWLAERRAWPM